MDYFENAVKTLTSYTKLAKLHNTVPPDVSTVAAQFVSAQALLAIAEELKAIRKLLREKAEGEYRHMMEGGG